MLPADREANDSSIEAIQGGKIWAKDTRFVANLETGGGQQFGASLTHIRCSTPNPEFLGISVLKWINVGDNELN